MYSTFPEGYALYTEPLCTRALPSKYNQKVYVFYHNVYVTILLLSGHLYQKLIQIQTIKI